MDLLKAILITSAVVIVFFVITSDASDSYDFGIKQDTIKHITDILNDRHK